MTPKQTFLKHQLEYAASLREAGFSNAEIAEKCGLATSTVIKYIGLQPRDIVSASMKRAWRKRKNAVVHKNDLAKVQGKQGGKKMKVTVYTDGSCLGNPGKGGWAAKLRVDLPNGCAKERIVKGRDPLTTNNRMELTAVVEAVKCISKPCTMLLYTDSMYVCGNYSRVPYWMQRGWKTVAGTDIRNRDLWSELDQLVRDKGIDIRFMKVPGHAGVSENEAMDALAKSEASFA